MASTATTVHYHVKDGVDDDEDTQYTSIETFETLLLKAGRLLLETNPSSASKLLPVSVDADGRLTSL